MQNANKLQVSFLIFLRGVGSASHEPQKGKGERTNCLGTEKQTVTGGGQFTSFLLKEGTPEGPQDASHLALSPTFEWTVQQER